MISTDNDSLGRRNHSYSMRVGIDSVIMSVVSLISSVMVMVSVSWEVSIWVMMMWMSVMFFWVFNPEVLGLFLLSLESTV